MENKDISSKHKFMPSVLRSILKILAWAVLIPVFLVCFAAVLWQLLVVIDRIPKAVACESYGEYTAELLAVGSPDWPFGSQDGQIVLKKNGFSVCRSDFTLRNDGIMMSEDNWDVEWEEDKAVITICGEEQKDKIFLLYYDGLTVVKKPLNEISFSGFVFCMIL
ncbi:MAG: hypothetical protein IJ784_06900 [Ruminiclostridium sp.]|nr:hypothetical protein [Ruminiclostridium sp.]